MAADTPLGSLAVEGWPASSPGGPAHVMIRPEQLLIGEAASARVAATVESYQYFGHDAVVRVRPEVDQLPELVVRVTGGTPLVAGARVGLTVRARSSPGPSTSPTTAVQARHRGIRHDHGEDGTARNPEARLRNYSGVVRAVH